MMQQVPRARSASACGYRGQDNAQRFALSGGEEARAD